MKISSLISPTTLWYLSAVAAGAYIYITTESWLNVAVIFGLYVIGFMLASIEYSKGRSDATAAHNAAMEKALAENREWLDNYRAEQTERLADERTATSV